MEETKSKILIVDDHSINREIINKILKDSYSVLEADNGNSAYEMIESNPNISVILLDLVMPGMNGYEFMEKISTSKYSNIPIIVMTAESGVENESKVLENGAFDYITKPVNSKILMSRVHNAVVHNQIILLEKMKFMSNHDSLTGLYNRNKMFLETKKMLESNRDKQFALIRYDIDRFRLYNSAMGNEEGNRLLKFISERIVEKASGFNCITYGRISADVFCICEPYDMIKIDEQIELAEQYRATYREDYVIDSTFGIYLIEDADEDVETMFTKATMAAYRCKHLNGVNVAFYEESMGREIEHERWVVKEMKKALLQEQFKVFLQPKYSLKTGKACGAEALVRWISPEAGTIFPSRFIPIFEKNGFVANLDNYMWEHVCMLLNKWKKEGKKLLPVSVNMSRISLYNPHVAEQMKALVNKYDIEPEFLNLEVTESAYMSNPELMKSTVEKLQAEGFVILMDDFGSGYSSLNTLKEIEVDVLKVDMKFLPNGRNDVRSEKILSSVIRMAGWLGTPVIAEGVETYEQKEFLESIGCGYVQGYYYARPMPVEEYEALLEKEKNNPDANEEMLVNQEKIDAIWSSNPQIDEILKGISLPVAMIEVSNNIVEIVRINWEFMSQFEFDGKASLTGILANEDERRIAKTFKESKEQNTTSETEFLYRDNNGKEIWLRMKVRLISQIEKADMYCVIFMDITMEKEYERRLGKMSELFASSITKKKMLVVDDQEVSRTILKKLFEDSYDIIEAVNGREALDKLKEYYDDTAIILLDMIMPKMGGKEFLLEKNRLGIGENIPVVVVSSESDTNIQLNMLKLGVNDYIVKPYIPELTKEKIKKVIESNAHFQNLLNEYNRAVNAGLAY